MSAETEFGDGISEAALKAAIDKSGYLMQSTVVDKLSKHFPILGPNSFIQEEWTYVDNDSGEVRAVDALVDFALKEPRERKLGSISPYLNLIVECKQSTLPYIFFLRDHPLSATMNFPELGGLQGKFISLFFESEDFDAEAERKDRFPGYGMTYHDALRFMRIPFFSGEMAPLAISLSKAAWRKGGSLELTGEEAYRSLTLPIFKAMDHLSSLVRPDADEPKSERMFVNLRFILGLAVLRAPMVAVSRAKSGEVLQNVPWVRMSRLEPAPSPRGGTSRTEGNVRLYDIVHEDFLDEYLSHLKEALEKAVENIERWEEPIFDAIGCTCKAFRRPDTPEGDVDYHRIHKEQARWMKDGGTVDPHIFISAVFASHEKPKSATRPQPREIEEQATGKEYPADEVPTPHLPLQPSRGRPVAESVVQLEAQSIPIAEPDATDNPLQE
ncbi:hypothetical protein ACFV7R_11770 [Streptomyces sp. NPDC059866]|uniref:hypothetical protein n=1 Tax=Streptomyces sp. NPDC059866 TaxID=3346978 RepID=UPI0036471FDC